MAPPPTRGWTHCVELVHRDLAGSPAHAGMDLLLIGAGETWAWLPRPRGDGPAMSEVTIDLIRAPPPTRGWTLITSKHIDLVHGSPAHAGMDPGRATRFGIRRRLPRPRGDGPFFADRPDGGHLAPPPTRGWTLLALGGPLLVLGSPAHAGMDLARLRKSLHDTRLPRPRGDGPQDRGLVHAPPAAPPPTRGWTQRASMAFRRFVGSPAHAGMDPSTRRRMRLRCRLPRPRGDGPAGSMAKSMRCQAPPPTRGWTVNPASAPCREPGSPAHAGMDPSTMRRRCAAGRLPRPRGDGPRAERQQRRNEAAPPPTRGWTFGVTDEDVEAFGSPAHAGMDRFSAVRAPSSRWLPRPRGDGPRT